jgi:LSD1 subclass zinc finger protein
MKRDDVMCPSCRAGFRRLELRLPPGSPGEVRCPLCDALLETLDGSTAVAYRLTVAPERIFDVDRKLGKATTWK